MMKVFAVLSLYIVFALILGILAFVLKKRHTRFPDFTVGYHDKRVMENKEKWECANHTAGNLCAFFVLVSAIASVLLYLLKASVEAMIILFFVLFFRYGFVKNLIAYSAGAVEKEELLS